MSASPAPTGSALPIRDAVTAILRSIGEDPNREGLLKTPERVEKAWALLASGYEGDPRAILEGAIFHEECNEMVLVREIEVYSLCEHHLLPFFGRCHVAYLPAGKIVGLSKIPRLVEVFSRRLQVQERLTAQIAHGLADVLEPHGVGVVIEARHLCMMMRGVEKQNCLAVTSCMLGSFRDDPKTRAEFMELVARKASI